MQSIKQRTAAVAMLFLGIALSSSTTFAQPTTTNTPVGELMPLSEKAQAAQNAQASPFRIRGLHVPLDAKRSPIRDLRPLIKHASQRGYNTVIFLMASNTWSNIREPEVGKVKLAGVTHDQMADLIAYCRSLKMEPIIGVKVVGKQEPIFGKLAKKYPDLLVGDPGGGHAKVLNSSFRFPDGRDPYEALVFPIFKEIISWYGDKKPEYMYLGNDEIPINAIAKVGKQRGLTAAQTFAQDLNRCTSYLLKRGVTPVMAGDMFLSPRLAKPGSGVKGFTFDPRFAAGDDYAYNAERWANSSGDSVLTSVNFLTNRDKIIIADWHYWTHVNGEYASVDYFQKLGFRVWGLSWYDRDAIRQFTRYAAAQHADGMVATTFYMAWKMLPWARVQLPPLINNSILYYINPDFEPAMPAFKSYRVGAQGAGLQADGDWGAVVPQSAKAAIIDAQIPDSVQAQRVQFWLTDENGGERLISQPEPLPAEKGRIRARIDLTGRKHKESSVFRLYLRYRDAATGYLAQRRYNGVVALDDAKPPVAGSASDHALYEVDFTALPDAARNARVLIAAGQYGGLVLLRGPYGEPWTPIAKGALKVPAVDAAFGYPQQNLWDAIAHKGMHLVIEAELTKRPKSSATVASFGDYHRGFRMMVHDDGRVLLQVGQNRDVVPSPPARVETTTTMQLDQWTKIEAWLTPPDDGGHRTLTLRMGEEKPQSVELKYPLVSPLDAAQDQPMGIGVEFKRGNINSKRRPNFPGLIRRVAILPFVAQAQPK